MNGTNQPTELNAGHDVLNALEGFAGAWTVVKKKQDAGAYLNAEEKKSDAAEEIPVGKLVKRNGFLFERLRQLLQAKPLVEPAAYVSEDTHFRHRVYDLRQSHLPGGEPGTGPAAAAEGRRRCGPLSRTCRCGRRTRFHEDRAGIARCSRDGCRRPRGRGTRRQR